MERFSAGHTPSAGLSSASILSGGLPVVAGTRPASRAHDDGPDLRGQQGGAVVEVREWTLGDRYIEEGAQRLPALAHVEDE